ncbi:amidoligase family protein [Modicisalibacter sp. 'Wilcox']|uniref:amidoligase family protein n=1 Tax=Modicisalibacter sp. 'Wilcox' TaxID=2679914 RepID=UPI0013D3DC8B|nr:amidoligase family protein [Modicisalibacter sp. 'Wilcox']
MTPAAPPSPCTPDGDFRRVGVEIEFAAIAPQAAAELVQSHFGGQIERLGPHRLKVVGTPRGEFTIELDAKYAHPDDALVQKARERGDDEWLHWRLVLHNRTRELIGDAVAGVVPTEIICPPLPWPALGELDALFAALRVQGARDTRDSLLYGFGLHLNPEVPATDAATLLAHLRAYLILADWLREQIDIDITRAMLPHANPFPRDYAMQVLDPDYRPDLDTLIDDYLAANPTRNRELDLCPLFAHLRPDSPHALLHEELVKPRPTFHYRLPNAQLSQPGSATAEWNRWVEVERLAADADLLAQRSADYLAHHRRPSVSRWLDRLREWMKEA